MNKIDKVYIKTNKKWLEIPYKQWKCQNCDCTNCLIDRMEKLSKKILKSLKE